MTITRKILTGLVPGLVAIALAFGAVGTASAQQVEMIEFMKAGPLGEKEMGNKDAPVTVVEYASLTCPHCAHFAETVFPKLKEKYIDTGKVRFIYRDFPLNDRARVAAMFAHCVPKENYFDFVDILFKTRLQWATAEPEQFKPALFAIARQVGFTQESLKPCVENQKTLDAIFWVEDRASQKFGVNQTPTVFVNGVNLGDDNSFEALDKAIAKAAE